MRRAEIKKSNFVVGGFIFLKGEQVIAKYQVTQIKDDVTTLTMVFASTESGRRQEKSFEYKGIEYKVGYPLFKQGLRAYPFKPSYDLIWKAYNKKQELNFLVAKNEKFIRRIAKIKSPDKVLRVIKVTEQYHENLRKALRKQN
jgi:hypothetical protein